MPDIDKVHQEAMERFDRVTRDEREQRDASIEDIMFAQVEGSQWDESARNTRVNRPRYEINKIALPINQAIGDQRQTRIANKIRPRTSGTDEDTASAFEGLIRSIEVNSGFDKVKDNGYKEVVNGGIGAWYVTTEFADDDVFEQDIVIKKITSAASSVYMDPTAKHENKKDALWGFVVEEISEEQFKFKWPDAVVSDVSANNQSTTFRQGWRTQDTVRVADYWVVEPVNKKIALMTDGTVITIDSDTEKVLDELAEKQVFIAKDASGNEKVRTVKSQKVVHYKISGAEILSGPNEWAGKYIPIVLVYGYNIWVNGKHYWSGMVRRAKDAQRVYNYATSAAIEASSLSPKDPFWLTPKQAEGHERKLEQFPVRNSPFMFYNPDPEAPGPPTRTGAPAVQTALIQQVAQADVDIQATTGRFAPSLGDNPADQSGKALLAVQQQGEAGTFELVDNLAGAVEFTGEILVDLIPKIYDTHRQQRILNPDGTTELIEVNKTIVDEQTQEKVILNDLSQGKYSVVTDTGPSYKTQRTEALNFLNSLSQSSPLFAELAPDLLAKNVDFEFSKELEDRVRKIMLQRGIVDPNEKETQRLQLEQQQQANQPPDPIAQMQIESLKLDLEAKAAEVDKIALENEKLQADIQNQIADTQKKLVESQNTKAETAATLQETAGSIPVTPEENEALEANMREFNEALIGAMTQELPEEEPPFEQEVEGQPIEEAPLLEQIPQGGTLPEGEETPVEL